MFVRHLTGLVLIVALAPHALAQKPNDPGIPEDKEPRLRIQIDVTATVPDDERWIELHSSNFLLVGTVSEGDLKKIAADLELTCGRERFRC